MGSVSSRYIFDTGPVSRLEELLLKFLEFSDKQIQTSIIKYIFQKHQSHNHIAYNCFCNHFVFSSSKTHPKSLVGGPGRALCADAFHGR